jgi:hypothetical protein
MCHSLDVRKKAVLNGILADRISCARGGIHTVQTSAEEQRAQAFDRCGHVATTAAHGVDCRSKVHRDHRRISWLSCDSSTLPDNGQTLGRR